MIYIIVLISLLVMSYRFDVVGKEEGKWGCYYIMLVIFILIAGLRFRLGVDTPAYIDYFYHVYPALDDFSFEDYPIGKDPLYVLLNSIVLSFGGRFYMVQFIQSAFVNILIFRYIRKHSSYIFTCLFFYAIMCYTNFNMEIMRGSMSIVICLFANDYLCEHKWLKAYCLMFIALLFHIQTILLFILPLFSFLRLNRKGLVILITAIIVGHIVQVTLGNYFDLLSFNESFAEKATGYADSDEYGAQKGNFNYFIVKLFPNIIMSLFSLFVIKSYFPNNKLLKLEQFIMMGLVFIFVQMSFQAAYRYVDYFKIYFVLLYSELFVLLLKTTKLSKGVAYVRVLVVFIPIFLLTFYGSGYYMGKNRHRYYPYSSVFERRIDKNRELLYNSLRDDLPRENKNEY